MTQTKTISGTITGGYTLSSAYQALTLTGAGRITGQAGTPTTSYYHGSPNEYYMATAGGIGLVSNNGAYLNIQGAIAGGAGGAGRYTFYGAAGGAGVVLTAGGTVGVSGSIVGGAGGSITGVTADYQFAVQGGGNGGAGVVLSASLPAGGALNNTGSIAGGAGGGNPFLASEGGEGPGGFGGAGLVLTGGGTVSNSGSITGGAGGSVYAGAGGNGGDGVVLQAGGAVNNSGSIRGGAGGGGGLNYGFPNGAAGAGVRLTAGGAVSNSGSISGNVGVYAGPTGAATVINFGAIGGTSGVAVQFKSAADRLIAEAGSTWNGAVQGGGGTLELASGTGTLTGLGASGTVSGAEAMTVSGFGTYQLDAGTSWTLTGTNTLAAGQSLTVGGALANTGALAGAAGAVGGYGHFYGGAGGHGGDGVDLASGGILTNTGTVVGGAGGVGGAAYIDSPGVGGSGGVGVALAGAGTVTNTGGTISGGAGGVGGAAAAAYHDSSAGGAGGAGVTLAGVATLTNTGGTIAGGAGGKGGSGYTNGGNGGAGAAGVLATAGGTISNTGAILGGAGGAGGTASGSRYHGGAAGAAGDGVVLMAGGSLVNGSKTTTTALISGLVGVYAGPAGAAKVTNFGTIAGAGGVAVQFKSSGDKLIAEAGSTWIGSVQGGGGTLDLANGTGTVAGLGGAATVSGAEAMSFSGFGSYEFGKGSWTLAGTNTLAAGAALTDNAKLTNTGAVTLAGSVGGKGVLTFAGGTAAIDAGAKISVATWSLTGGTTSLNESLTFKGAFSETAGATLTVATGDKLTLSGASSLGGLIDGAGTVSAANATLDKGLVIGGTDVLTITGAATQTGTITIGDATANGAKLSIAKGASLSINGAFGIAEGTATTSSLTVAGTLIKSGATGRSVIALATTDTGLIKVATGTLDFAGALTGTGALKIAAGAVLEADSTVAKTLTASFNGATATLALKAPATFAATIAGFAPGDTIDLIKIAATGASINAKDQLVIVNGGATVARLQLTGTYTGATFTIGADGHGGTDVTLLTAAAVPPPHALIAAMAGLGGAGAAAHVAAGDHPEAWRPSLWAPRMRVA